jgi:hypothetical protein
MKNLQKTSGNCFFVTYNEPRSSIPPYPMPLFTYLLEESVLSSTSSKRASNFFRITGGAIETLPLSPLSVFAPPIDEVKINLLLNLSQSVVWGDSLLEVYLMIKEFWLKTFLLTHHAKTPFTEFTILINPMDNTCKDYLGNSPLNCQYIVDKGI